MDQEETEPIKEEIEGDEEETKVEAAEEPAPSEALDFVLKLREARAAAAAREAAFAAGVTAATEGIVAASASRSSSSKGQQEQRLSCQIELLGTSCSFGVVLFAAGAAFNVWELQQARSQPIPG